MTISCLGHVSYGLTRIFTGFANLQADNNGIMLGAGGIIDSPVGQLDFGLGASIRGQSTAPPAGVSGNSVYGYAGRVLYSISPKSLFGLDVSLSIRFLAEARSQKFSTLRSSDIGKNAVAEFSAIYSQRLPFGALGSVSGNYNMLRRGGGFGYDSYGETVSLSRYIFR
jgi:hypothetical protein